jgi:hypothetical protein
MMGCWEVPVSLGAGIVWRAVGSSIPSNGFSKEKADTFYARDEGVCSAMGSLSSTAR